MGGRTRAIHPSSTYRSCRCSTSSDESLHQHSGRQPVQRRAGGCTTLRALLANMVMPTGKTPIEDISEDGRPVFRPTSPYQAARRGDHGYAKVPSKCRSGPAPVTAIFSPVYNAAWATSPAADVPQDPPKISINRKDYNSDSMICSSRAEAERVASFCPNNNEFSATVARNGLAAFLPKSLSHQAVPSHAERRRSRTLPSG